VEFYKNQIGAQGLVMAGAGTGPAAMRRGRDAGALEPAGHVHSAPHIHLLVLCGHRKVSLFRALANLRDVYKSAGWKGP